MTEPRCCHGEQLMNFPLWPAIKNVLLSSCQHAFFFSSFHIGGTLEVNSDSAQSFWTHCGQKYAVT